MRNSPLLYPLLFFLLIVLLSLSVTSSMANDTNQALQPSKTCPSEDCSSALDSAIPIKNLSVKNTLNATSTTLYVANSATDCAVSPDPTNCYFNGESDGENGLGTGLREAVLQANPDDEIVILKDYAIKSNTVLIDKAVSIRGHENSMITYKGSICGQPMLAITAGGSIKDLTINDGNCSNPSRTLILINSNEDVSITHNTLHSGMRAVDILDIAGNVTVAFNHINNNQSHAIFHEEGDAPGTVNIYANNILNNRPAYVWKVNCNDRGRADHNFWGEGVSAENSAGRCVASDEKRLGAPILRTSGHPGVEALRHTVTDTMTYIFNNNIGMRKTSGSNYELIVVNHGHGAVENIPFYNSGAGGVEACSDFYDIFLADGAGAADLILAFKYNLSERCVNIIQSADYCGQPDQSKYPLWWYDPGNNITDGWHRTGDTPRGFGASGEMGQMTTCNLDEKELRVIIDYTGRPGLTNDLNFTPFVVGLPLIESIIFSEFSASLQVNSVALRWITSFENNIQKFYVLRSESANGPFTRISNQIDAIGSIHIGGTYTYTDTNIIIARNYYYKIEVIDQQDNPIRMHGPVSIFTATPTPTITQTLTPFPTRTATPYVFRSPTPHYQPVTPTSGSSPTQVRTYGPSPTAIFPEGRTPTIDLRTAYPIGDDKLTATSAYLDIEKTAEEEPTLTTPIMGEIPTDLPDDDAIPSDTGEDRNENLIPTPVAKGDDSQETESIPVRWSFVAFGFAGSLGLFGAISLLLSKLRLT